MAVQPGDAGVHAVEGFVKLEASQIVGAQIVFNQHAAGIGRISDGMVGYQGHPRRWPQPVRWRFPSWSS